MTVSVRRVATAVLAALAFAAATSTSANAYSVRAGEIYAVSEVDRVSATQLFARDADILSTGLSYIKLSLTVPGRVYVRHVANETAAAAGLFGTLRVSGGTRGAIERIQLPELDAEEPAPRKNDTLSVQSPSEVRPVGSASESLLLEIELYRKNVVRSVSSFGSADVVVLEDVLSAASNATEELQLWSTRLWKTMMPGNLFVSDPMARLTAASMSVITEDFSSVQLDVASLNAPNDGVSVWSQATTNVTIFASESVSLVRLDIKTRVGSEQAPRNPLCVATKDDVKVKLARGPSSKYSEDAVIPGGSTCVKRPLPPCEPALIDGRTGETSADFKEAVTPTFPPLATGASRTETPVPRSSASSSSVGSRLALVAVVHLVTAVW